MDSYSNISMGTYALEVTVIFNHLKSINKNIYVYLHTVTLAYLFKATLVLLLPAIVEYISPLCSFYDDKGSN